MAIKFAIFGCFRSELKQLIEDNPENRLGIEQELVLRSYLLELEGQVIEGRIDGANERVIGPGVDLRIDTEFIERSTDPERTAEICLQIHQVLFNTRVSTDIYRDMGRLLKEFGVTVDNQELNWVIEEANYRSTRVARDSFGWHRLQHSGDFIPRIVVEIQRAQLERANSLVGKEGF